MTAGWVLWWRYSDGSGAGVVRAYTHGGRAQADFDLVKKHQNVDYELVAVEIYDDSDGVALPPPPVRARVVS